MRVADIGDHIRCCVPGGRSLVTMGMPGVTNTSQFSGMSRVSMSVIWLSPLLVARSRAGNYSGSSIRRKRHESVMNMGFAAGRNKKSEQDSIDDPPFPTSIVNDGWVEDLYAYMRSIPRLFGAHPVAWELPTYYRLFTQQQNGKWAVSSGTDV